MKPRFRSKIRKYIRHIPLTGGEWTTINTPLMKEYKKTLRNQLSIYQNDECAFCGLKLNETGKAELEHIAPKGGKKRPKYVQYTFTTYNLVLACSLCNSPIKKGSKDTIDNFDKTNKNYRQNNFNIYHPYFDDPNEHFEYRNEKNVNIIIGISKKGIHSIDVFDLNSEAHCIARAKNLLYEALKQNDDLEKLLKQALIYPKTS